jgi:DNA-directed RNA polymerase specialized sigma24 family protein
LSETASFEEFVGARADALMRYAYVLTGNPDDAADLLQESLVRVRGAWHGVINKSEPEGWQLLLGSSTNLTIHQRTSVVGAR